jgi:prepilin-type N-terminal cleavage/methylation domain-containing protein
MTLNQHRFRVIFLSFAASGTMAPVSARLRHGFTLIELLLVVGIISILVGITIAALAPTKQLASARDAKRQADVNSILSAVYQYLVDFERLPPGIPSGTAREICATDATDCDAAISLDVLTGAYLVRIPLDPQRVDTATGTNYWIVRDPNGRITVTAPGAEEAESIGITR